MKIETAAWYISIFLLGAWTVNTYFVIPEINKRLSALEAKHPSDGKP